MHWMGCVVHSSCTKCFSSPSLTYGSPTARTQHLVKQETIQFWTPLTPIQTREGIRDSCNVACTSPPMLYLSPTVVKNTIFRHTIRSDSATSEYPFSNLPCPPTPGRSPLCRTLSLTHPQIHETRPPRPFHLLRLR